MLGLAVAVAGCGRIGFDASGGDASDAAGGGDAPIDAMPAACTIAPNIRVSNGASTSNRVALAPTGTGIAATWEDSRDGNDEIYFAAFDAAGTPTTAEVRVTNTAATSMWPSVAFSGSTYGVMWAELGGGMTSTMMFQELASDGTLLGPPVTLGTSDSSYVPSRWQRWVGNAYVVVWQQTPGPGSGDDIYDMLLDADGNVQVPAAPVTASPGSSGFPYAAGNGNGFGVAWNDDRDGNAEIYFAALAADGTKLGNDVRVTNAPDMSFAPALDSTATGYAVTWWDRRSGTAEQYVAILDADGARVGPEIEVTPGQYSQVGIVKWSGRDFGISWFDFRNGVLEPYFARLDRNGEKVGDDLRVSTGGLDCDAEAFDMIRTADGYAIAWADQRTAGNTEVYLSLATCP